MKNKMNSNQTETAERKIYIWKWSFFSFLLWYRKAQFFFTAFILNDSVDRAWTFKETFETQKVFEIADFFIDFSNEQEISLSRTSKKRYAAHTPILCVAASDLCI